MSNMYLNESQEGVKEFEILGIRDSGFQLVNIDCFLVLILSMSKLGPKLPSSSVTFAYLTTDSL